MNKKIQNIINYWFGNRKNTMDVNLLESGIEDLLKAQKQDLLEKIEGIEVWKALQGIFYDAFNYGKKETCTKEQRQKVIEKALEDIKKLLK